MIVYHSDSSLSNLESRSGVYLNYAPEDTLKSFLMEEHFAAVSNREDSRGTDSSLNVGKAIDLLHFNSSVSVDKKLPNNLLSMSAKRPDKPRRPFLRKNQGRAAWCSRLRLPRDNFNGNAILVPFQQSSSDATNVIAGSITKIEIGQAKQNDVCPTFLSSKTSKLCAQNSRYSHLSAGQHHSKAKDECISGDDPSPLKSPKASEERTPINHETNHETRASTADLSVDGELEEFELLERFTESQLCNGTRRCKSDSHHSSEQHSESPKLAVELGTLDSSSCAAGACGSVEFKDNREVDKNKSNHEMSCLRNVQGHHFECSPASRTFGSSKINPTRTPERVSSDIDDRVPWKDEHEIIDLPDSSGLCLNRQQSLPSRDLNIPNTSGAAKLDAGNKPDNSPDEAHSSSSAVVKVWIMRLEAEVKRFNLENVALAKLKAKNEEALAALEKAKKDFEIYKEATVKDFEAYRLEEINKFKKERKVLSEYHRSLQSMPKKRDREEIERLRQQILDEKTESSQREIRLQQQISRQRTRIDELTTEKTELLERIKRLEHARFSRHNSSPLEGTSWGPKVHSHLHKNIPEQIGCAVQCINLRSKTATSVNHEASRMERRAHSSSSGPTSTSRAAISRVFTPMSSSNCLQEVFAEQLPQPPTSLQPSDNTFQQKPSRASLLSPIPPDCNDQSVMREICYPSGSLERFYCDGSETNKCSNASQKEISSGKTPSVMRLLDGDTTEMNDGAVVYPCSPEDTVQASPPGDAEEVAFKNGQKLVTYIESDPSMLERPTQSAKTSTVVATLPNQQESWSPNFITTNDNQPLVVEESCRPDGMSVRIFSNGDKVISLPNGQQEVHCEAFKRRVYPDGTLKTVFKDGRQETRYASGRIRVKDSAGNLLVDTRIAPVSRTATDDLAAIIMSPH